jgi:membrane-bound lytic murein transglycosylase A
MAAGPALVRVQPADCPDFADDLGFEGLEQSLSQSVAYLGLLPASREFEFGPDRFTAAHLLLSLQRFQSFIRLRPTELELQQHLRAFYRIYQAIGRDQKGEVLYTGYYEPYLKGCSSRTPECRYPVYGRPEDLMIIDLGAFAEKFKGEKIIGRVQNGTVVPFHDRRDIDEANALLGKAKPLAWVDDPVELFFLHIQGSGRIILENGQTLAVGYDSSNGRPYRSIGQLLIEEGKVSREEMSMQRIRYYLNQNQAEIRRILNHNPSYIFFKLTPDGPLGSLNVKLTPGRSLALDRKLFPPAALAFAMTQKPLVDAAGTITSWMDCRRFMLNQDTGGAITGPGRADFFWGGGPYAELAAGHLKHPGKLYFVVLKPEAAAP